MKRNQRIQKMTHGDVEIRHYLEQMNKNIMQSVLYKKFKYEKALININTTLADADENGRGLLDPIVLTNVLHANHAEMGLNHDELTLLSKALLRISSVNNQIRYTDMIEALRTLQRKENGIGDDGRAVDSRNDSRSNEALSASSVEETAMSGAARISSTAPITENSATTSAATAATTAVTTATTATTNSVSKKRRLKRKNRAGTHHVQTADRILTYQDNEEDSTAYTPIKTPLRSAIQTSPDLQDDSTPTTKDRYLRTQELTSIGDSSFSIEATMTPEQKLTSAEAARKEMEQKLSLLKQAQTQELNAMRLELESEKIKMEEERKKLEIVRSAHEELMNVSILSEGASIANGAL